MVANWQALPVELLQSIFQNFKDNPGNLYQCQLVCKSWAPNAQRELYTKVKVTSARCIAAINLALESNGVTLGNCVKMLHFRAPSTELLDTWQDIETKFPKLTCFSMDRPSKTYYTRIRLAHKDSKWLLLTGICRPRMMDEELMEDYMHCILEYPHHITSVYISDDGELVQRLYQQFNSQLNTLPKLKCLQLIKQINDSIFCLDSVIENCGTYLESIHMGLSTNEEYLLGEIHESTFIDMSCVIPRPYVKRFTCMGVIDRDRDLLYMMRKFPHVQHLYINSFEDTNVISSIVTSMLFRDPPGTCRFTSTVLANFIDFATKVPFHNIQHFPVTIDVAAEALQKFWTRQQPQDKSLTLRYKSSQYRPEFIQTVNSLLDIHDDNIGVLFTHLNGTTNLPHVEILARCGHLIRHLNLSFDHNLDMLMHINQEEDQEEEATRDHGYYVDQIIQQYTQKQFKKLVLDKCIMQQRLTTTHTPLSSSCITQLYFYYSKINMHLFSQFSTKLPQLKELHLICCTFTNGNQEQTTRKIHIQMQHTSLDILSVQHYTLPRMFFKISTASKSEHWLSSSVSHRDAMMIQQEPNAYCNSMHFQCQDISWYNLHNIAQEEEEL